MAETFKLEGLKELEAALGQMPRATARATGLRALRLGAEPIARAARRLAPVAEGNLVESIDVGTNLARSQRGDRGAVAPLEIHIGPGQQPQAIAQEFGTYKDPAQPFMTPAWEAERMNALDVVGTALGIEVEKTAARLAKKRAR
ncbi:HK97-gp10 family putative phage morphogenesis protein [Sphingobium sp. Cam5-1]|uniref:HK97-gp10 family putative phage morphogenesis protein n=1 Tax=Sphingobium sp. Cam5-1 TaxID=2789327 RepID=UPI0018AD1E16|nr:HK97-gp10 family putative phage morphogenesis protein [Sphingobium sp. Cam5-1]QPI73930.1 HK97 gp10 family phage protein [Sphingobium sp. Cam5-1]